MKEELVSRGRLSKSAPYHQQAKKRQLQPDGGCGHRRQDPVADVPMALCIQRDLGGAGDHTLWMHMLMEAQRRPLVSFLKSYPSCFCDRLTGLELVW